MIGQALGAKIYLATFDSLSKNSLLTPCMTWLREFKDGNVHHWHAVFSWIV